PDHVVLSENAAGRIVRSVLEKAASATSVDAVRCHPAQPWTELTGPTRQRGNRGHAGQHDVVVHKGDQRARQVLQQLQPTAGECALTVAMQLVLAAHLAVLSQA